MNLTDPTQNEYPVFYHCPEEVCRPYVCEMMAACAVWCYPKSEEEPSGTLQCSISWM